MVILYYLLFILVGIQPFALLVMFGNRCIFPVIDLWDYFSESLNVAGCIIATTAVCIIILPAIIIEQISLLIVVGCGGLWKLFKTIFRKKD